jgi:K+-transporting ATPase ATPase B chain
MMAKNKSAFEGKALKSALLESLKKLNPKLQVKNPVMFVVFIGAIISTFLCFQSASSFNIQISIWLWFTILFANFSEALAEGRGKAQADELKKMRVNSYARLLVGADEKQTLSSELKKGDLVICEAGDIIPGDGEVIEGLASVDESAITGESAPVIRESGGDRSAVTGGTRVISDKLIIKICSEQGDSFLDKMIALVEGAKRQKTPNEIALTILLSGLTIIFLLATATLKPFELFSLNQSGSTSSSLTWVVLIALLVCLIPTTIGGLLSAIGISGIDRLTKRNIIAKSGKAVEAAGDVDVLLLDKTGTITFGNRMATEFIPAEGVKIQELAEAAFISSLADETPEGRSIINLAENEFNLHANVYNTNNIEFIGFTAQTKMSGANLEINNTICEIRKGASEAIKNRILSMNGVIGNGLQNIVDSVAKEGSTPLVVSKDEHILGVIRLKDVVKPGIKERFERLRKMGIKTVMITGDNPLTAVAIAAEAGVDDFIAEATPEDKLNRIKQEQSAGKLVAMVGDGTNDAPALAQADVGVAMNAGTQAAREAGNMIDLDSDPTKLIEAVEIGKQLLMTRGALTTFSIANDAAKYFAILPAVFVGLYAQNGKAGALSSLNLMRLSSPESAILSSVIFNALIIVALIPIAIKGVKYSTGDADSILKKNLLIYGLGGLIAPFVGIKIIDLIISFLGII